MEEEEKEFLSFYCPICLERFDIPMPKMIRSAEKMATRTDPKTNTDTAGGLEPDNYVKQSLSGWVLIILVGMALLSLMFACSVGVSVF